MILRIFSSESILSGDQGTLEKIYEFFSFKDKAAESQIRRFKSGLFYKEKGLYNSDGELPAEYTEWKKTKLTALKDAVHVHACRWTPGPHGTSKKDLIVPTGLLSSLVKYCTENRYAIELNDSREFSLTKKLLTGARPRALRRPQEEALVLLKNKREIVDRGMGLIRLATGVGKTALAQELIRHFGTKSIFLVPSLPILKQTVKRFEKAFGSKYVKAFGCGKKQVGYITVATYQSVYAADPEDFKDINLVIGDEAHHVAADTFFEVMMVKLKAAVHRYGLSAWEKRADGSTMLIEAAVGPVVYSYDAAEAIEDEYLARPTYIIYDVWKTRGKWTNYKIKDKKRVADRVHPSAEYDGPDDLKAYRNWVLGNDFLNESVAGLVNAFVADGKSILILVDEKEHGDRLMQLIPNAGYCIGGGVDNERLQKEFNARKLKVLIGTSTLGEGADTVPVDVLIELQGGASISKTLQADGRALRNDPDDNGVPRKPETLIIDFNFPLCKLLERHSKARETVHKSMGEVYHDKLT